MGTKKSAKRTISGKEAMEFFKGILQPVAEQIAELRVQTNGIVFVIHDPGPLVHNALKAVGMKAPSNRTTVIASPCSEAARVWGHDPITRKWCEKEPADGEIKVFLLSGNGTKLLTLIFEDGNVILKSEPDIYPVH